jgi:cyanophycin synthetase
VAEVENPRWPVEVRYLFRAARRLGYELRDVSGDGYLLEVGDGRRVIPLAAGRVCLYPTNSASAVGISRDKLHTSHLMEAHGLRTLGGRLFFVTGHHRAYRGPGLEVADALEHAVRIGFPVFAKPNQGARGDLAEIVPDAGRLRAYLAEAATRYDSVLLQQVFGGPEYRVLCVGGRVVAAVRRSGVEVAGDGERSLRQLVGALNERLAGTGVSGVDAGLVDRVGGQTGRDPDAVLPAGERVPLPGRANLSAGGRAEEILVKVPEPLVENGLRAAAASGLHVAGVDLMDVSAGADLSDLRVVEVNGAPGLTALDQGGRFDLILGLWRDVLGLAFGGAR